MTTTAQLEREAEQSRQQLADALDELRACMTPGQVIDQLSDYARDGAAATILQNLKTQSLNNPLPLLMRGASFAWLMLGNRTASADGGARRAAERFNETASEVRQATRDAVEGARHRFSETTDAGRHAAQDIANATRHAAQQAGDGLSNKSAELSGKISELAADTRAKAGAATRRVSDAAADA